VKTTGGFTLIELMVVVIVIAVLAAIALPSYLNQTRKARRSAAEGFVQQIALLEERYRSDNTSYYDPTVSGNSWTTLGMADPTSTYYTYTFSNVAATSYKVTATPQGNQAADKASGTPCNLLAYDYGATTTGVTTTTPSACWAK
jgi:type IV pilus assembly protein PilE